MELTIIDFKDIDRDIQALIKTAHSQTEMAYAPYSEFYVGAAALLSTGEVIVGSNQENASYPLCICAERVALGTIGATYKDFKITALAVTAHNPKKKLLEPCMPCGACRQVISEYEERQSSPISIYTTALHIDKVAVFPGISTLLPFRFGKLNLL